MSHSNSFSESANGLREQSRDELIQILNQQLAHTVDLRSHVKNAYWNLKGPCVEPIRLLLDGLRRELRRFCDVIAKRINVIGGQTTETVRAAYRSMHDYPLDLVDAHEHLEALLSSYSRYERGTQDIIAKARRLGDSDSVDFLLAINIAIEKDLCVLAIYFEAAAIGLHGEHLPEWKSTFEVQSISDDGR